MILNRKYYLKNSLFERFWAQKRARALIGSKVFKAFKLFQSVIPDKIYFYSPKLKRIPRFTGHIELLSQWKESKSCERICPTLAIQVNANAIIIDDRGCIACGLCVEFAPPGILEMPTDLVSVPQFLNREDI